MPLSPDSRRERTKAAYLRFEADPDLEFQYYLAQKLGRTVAELGDLSHDEYLHWGIYYRRLAQRQELEMKRGGAS